VNITSALVVHLLLAGAEWRDPNPERAKVTALEHALQTATRAEMAGADTDETVGALLHDAGRVLSDEHHGEVMAEILRGRVRPEVVDAVRGHGRYQAAVLAGEGLPDGTPEAQRLACWDAASFEPGWTTLPLGHFLPLLEQVFADRARVDP
jgi:predicted HD phosphohydrolase